MAINLNLGSVALPVLVLLCWLPYRSRTRTLARDGRPVPDWRRACFAAGLVVLALALSPPVDRLSDQLLVVHMAEHLLIGDIAALLIEHRAEIAHVNPAFKEVKLFNPPRDQSRLSSHRIRV